MLKRFSLSVLVLVAFVVPAVAQTAPDLRSAVALFQTVRTVSNLVYLRANGWEGKLDVYAQRTPPNSAPAPVVIFIHGGGWVQGTKEASVLQGVLPYIERVARARGDRGLPVRTALGLRARQGL